jgi:hypothetical protein
VRTLAHARQRIIELTSVDRSNEQVRQFLRRHGFKPFKVGSIPAKADTEAQADFKKTSLTLGYMMPIGASESSTSSTRLTLSTVECWVCCGQRFGCLFPLEVGDSD